MSKKNKHVSAFSLEGRFLGFLVEDGYKLKWLRLATAEGEHCIKLSKESRASVGRVLVPGHWIQVWGEKTVYSGTADAKLKAYQIRVVAPGSPESSPLNTAPAAPKPSVSAPATVLVCQKSDCMKRGGKAVCKALEAALDDRGLTGQVTVRGTGCMKHCKAGPNLVVMPDKTRYSRISAADIPELIDKHFSGHAQKQANPQERLPVH